MQDFLDKILPTRQSIWIAGTSITLTINAYFLREWLQKAGIQLDILSKIEIRLLLALFVLCVCLFLLIVSIVSSFNEKGKEHKKEIESLNQYIGLKEERKLRIKKWREEIQMCESLQDLYSTSVFVEIESLLNTKES